MTDTSATASAERPQTPPTGRDGISLVDVLPQHRFDEAALWRYLADHLPEFTQPAALRQFQGGQSNPTFLIETPTRKFVLRKKPPGKLLPSAHLVEREFRILRALPADVVPIPKARVLCEDTSVIGTAFYVMDHVTGRVLAQVALPQQTPAERSAIYADFARVMANLHRVDWRACGLADFGKPERYVARQVDRWTKQYIAAKTAVDSNMEQLIDWLTANIPAAEETTIAHGDYRLGNLLFHPTEPRAIALLDWELSTLGHPLSDLAYACMYYRLPANADGTGGLGGLDLPALGIPAEEEFLAAYCKHAGRSTVDNWTFFLAFAFFRMASITQGVYARALQGNAADQRAIGYGDSAKQFSRIGWSIASGQTR
jgi:aminoglycoside phosphotransferase (APT) family kinase protein